MFWKLSKNSPVKNILVITLSNIGDVVLSAPVMDILLRDFPLAKLSLVIGERASSLFEGNSRISQIHIFDKMRTPLEHLRWTWGLRKYHYDLVIDLRNSMIGYFLTPKWMMPPLLFPDKTIHLKQQHLNRLRSLYDFEPKSILPVTITPSLSDERLIDGLVNDFLEKDLPFIFIAPYAADLAKTWDAENFVNLSKELFIQYGLKIIMIGSAAQKENIDGIIAKSGADILNLAGKTNLIQIAALIKRAKVAIVHDSGPMHIASYFNKPVIALFGPTDPQCSSPWSSIFKVVHRNNECRRCLKPKDFSVLHNCMAAITQQDVLAAFAEVYGKVQ